MISRESTQMNKEYRGTRVLASLCLSVCISGPIASIGGAWCC
jgi:hypothetical protein